MGPGFGEKGVIFNVQCFTVKRRGGGHLAWKVSVLPQKRGRFELKSQCFATKKGVIFKLENKDG